MEELDLAKGHHHYEGLGSGKHHRATHPLWGLIILFGMLGLIFWLTYSIGGPCKTCSILTWSVPWRIGRVLP